MVTRVDENGTVWGLANPESLRRYHPVVRLGEVAGVPAFETDHGTVLCGWRKGTRPLDPTGEVVAVAPIQRHVLDYDNIIERVDFDNTLDWSAPEVVKTHALTISMIDGVPTLANAPEADRPGKFLPSSVDPLCTGLNHPAALDDLTNTGSKESYRRCANAAMSYCKANPYNVYCACRESDRCNTASPCHDADPRHTFLFEPQHADPGLSCGASWAFANAVGPYVAGAGLALLHRKRVNPTEFGDGAIVGIVLAILLFLLLVGVALRGRHASP